MKSPNVVKGTLLISGLMAAGFGGAILFIPVTFYATYGIELGDSISLLNELRGSGGALLASGILIMSGAFVASLTFTSLVVSSLLYLSYGLARILSMAIDGMPPVGLVQSAILEIIIGLACVFALAKKSRSSFSLNVNHAPRNQEMGVNHGNFSDCFDLSCFPLFPGGRFPVCFRNCGDARHKKPN